MMEKSEINEKKVISLAKSSDRTSQLRKGNGFSLAEIKAAGKNIHMIKQLGIKIDYFRKSTHEKNIEELKKLKIPVKKIKKREPFVRKDKKARIRKVKIEKKEKPIEKIEETIKVKKVKKEELIEKEAKPEEKVEEISIQKEEVKPVKEKSKKKQKEKKEKKVSKEEKGTPLTQLSGLGATSEKKFKEVGVNTIEDLVSEDLNELMTLISGISEDRLKKWVEEGKALLNK